MDWEKFKDKLELGILSTFFLLCLISIANPLSAQYVYESNQPLIDLTQESGTTSLNSGDDQLSNAFNLNFTFNLYDQSFTSARMATNGCLHFNLGTANQNYNNYCGDYTPDPLPQYNYTLFPFWTDLIRDNQSKMLAKNFSDKSVFGWYNMREYNRNNTDNSFEVILWPNSTFDFRYGGLNIIQHDVLIGEQGDSNNYYQYLFYDECNTGTTNVAGTCVNTNWNNSTFNTLLENGGSLYGSGSGNGIDCSNPLNDSSCPGYAQAYETQQCGLNALYSENCSGYWEAFDDLQCSLDPQYAPFCRGYRQEDSVAFFDEDNVDYGTSDEDMFGFDTDGYIEDDFSTGAIVFDFDGTGRPDGQEPDEVFIVLDDDLFTEEFSYDDFLEETELREEEVFVINFDDDFNGGFNDPFGGPDEPFLDPLPFVDPSFQQIEELVLLETLETFPVPGFELDDPVSIDVEEIIETQIAAIEERREEREEREAEEEFAEVLEELFQDEAEGERLAEEVFEEEAVEETIEALEEIFEEELIAREEELEEEIFEEDIQVVASIEREDGGSSFSREDRLAVVASTITAAQNSVSGTNAGTTAASGGYSASSSNSVSSGNSAITSSIAGSSTFSSGSISDQVQASAVQTQQILTMSDSGAAGGEVSSITTTSSPMPGINTSSVVASSGSDAQSSVQSQLDSSVSGDMSATETEALVSQIVAQNLQEAQEELQASANNSNTGEYGDQTQLVAFIGFNPGFTKYYDVRLQDNSTWYKPEQIYANNVMTDNITAFYTYANQSINSLSSMINLQPELEGGEL